MTKPTSEQDELSGRCSELITKIQADAMLRRGSSVMTLRKFVQREVARARPKKALSRAAKMEEAVREFCRKVDLSDSYSGVPSGAYETILRESYSSFAKILEGRE